MQALNCLNIDVNSLFPSPKPSRRLIAIALYHPRHTGTYIPPVRFDHMVQSQTDFLSQIFQNMRLLIP
jgi:hypothetical protein